MNHPHIIFHGAAVHSMDQGRTAQAVAILDQRVLAIGSDEEILALRGPDTRVIDAQGLTLTPGFIDLHSHIENVLDGPEYRPAANFLLQGITTALSGNCGFAPIDLAAHLAAVEAQGVGVNYATLTGHGSIRHHVVGNATGAPSEDELERMRELTRQAMEAGAFGVSTGLEYRPGLDAGFEEIAALATVAAGYGGFYASHRRCEAAKGLEAAREAIAIAKTAGCPAEISHLKVDGQVNWGQAEALLDILREARAQGLDVTGDAYPYPGYQWIPELFIANEFREGGRFQDYLRDPAHAAIRARMVDSTAAYIAQSYGGDGERVILSHYTDPEGRLYEGCSLSEILRRRGVPVDSRNLAELVLEMAGVAGLEEMRITGMGVGMNDDEVSLFMAQDFVALCTDAHAVRLGQLNAHPRGFGAFPRLLGHYVRERGVLNLETALRKMIELPARRLGLLDRGVLREGAFADLVLFDPDTINDRGTFAAPLPPAGIRWVLVNGVVAVEPDPDGPGGRLALSYDGPMPGKVLRRGAV